MAEPVLAVRNLTKVFVHKGRSPVRAVDNVSFDVGAHETVGIVGGSGSGKSTIARMVCHLIEPTSGTITLDGRDVCALRGRGLRDLGQSVQMVFQNPQASFDPRIRIGVSAMEALYGQGVEKREARERIGELFERCGLAPEIFYRYPSEVSGGQCQRAAIARALAPCPSLIVLDETTSALDVTVQARIIELLRSLKEESGCAYLFICHDLALVQDFCDRVLVMRHGTIVEEGPAQQITSNPTHPYTIELLGSVLGA